jgi:hypothetical protein
MLKQLSVKMKDQPGELAKFTKMLNDSYIFIRSITVSQIPGLVLFLLDKPNDAIKLLKEKDYEFSVKDVIAALLPDNPTSSEEIQKIAQVLGDNGVNIDFLYNSYINKTNYLVLHVSDNDKAKDVLKKSGIYLDETI